MSLGYDLRLDVLERNGFRSYRHYMQSPLWKSIRERVLARDEYRCFACLGVADQVHHESYGDVTIRGEKIDRLKSVCAPCHRKIEFDNKPIRGKRRKRTFAQAKEAGGRLRYCIARKRARRESFESIEARRIATRIGDLSAAPDFVRAALNHHANVKPPAANPPASAE